MGCKTFEKRKHERLAAKGCSQSLTIKVIKYALKCRQDRNVSTVIGAEYNKIKKTGENKGYKRSKLHPLIRIDDAELQGLNIAEQTVIEEVVKNGKKHYCYTSKADFGCGIRNSTVSAEIEDGSVLPSVNRPRRTVIKL